MSIYALKNLPHPAYGGWQLCAFSKLQIWITLDYSVGNKIFRNTYIVNFNNIFFIIIKSIKLNGTISNEGFVVKKQITHTTVNNLKK